MFHPAMARHMIGSRIRVLDQSKRNAEMSGYRGAKFPWEQASTGEDHKDHTPQSKTLLLSKIGHRTCIFSKLMKPVSVLKFPK